MRIKNNRILKSYTFEITYLSVILFGIIITTALCLMNFDIYNLQMGILNKISTRSELLNVFFKAFLRNSSYVAIVFVCGFCAVLQPALFACGLAKGLEIATKIIFIYQALGIKGALVSLALVIVPSAFVIFALVLGAREAFYLSCNIAGIVFSEKNFFGLKKATKLYFLKFFIFEIFVVIGAFTECVFKVILPIFNL